MLEEDAEVGLLALEKGLITQEALNDCLSALSQDGERTLVDLLKDRNLLKPAELETLKTEAVRRVQDRKDAAEVHHPSSGGPDTAVLPAQEPPPQPEEPPLPEGVPPEAERAARDPENLIGKFIRTSELGKGGLGAAWKAWDSDAKRWVALKILKDVGGGTEGVDRFLKEAEADTKLSHPGIVSIYETGRQKQGGTDRAYIAMELVDGETLDVLHGKKGLSIQRAAEIVRDMCHAVAYAHQQGVIHRDLKPRNVFVDSGGQVRVMDFGLTQLAATLGPSDDAMLSRTIEVQGTPAYMSPEQALGRTGDIKERSDVYSLGATFYFLLTGKPPFEGPSPMKTCFAVVRDPLTPPTTHNPQVTPDLERLVLRAMAKDPVRRYESPTSLAADLDRFIQGVPILTDDQMRFTQGLSALHAGRLEEAIHMFKDLIRLEASEKSESSGYRAVIEQLKEGEKGLTLAIKQQQKNYDIRTQRGVYRFAQGIIGSLEGKDPSGNCKEALEDFVAAAELRPEYTPSRVNRANVLIFGGRYARDTGKDVSSVFKMAIKDLDMAIDFDNTCSPAYHNRGIVHFYMARSIRKGQGDAEPYYRKAIDDFSRAAELEQTYAYVFKDLGVAKVALAKQQLAQGRKVKNLFVEAVAHLDIACRLNASIYGAFYERGQAKFALKDFKKAIKDFKRCLELDPSRERKVQPLIDEAQRHMESRKY